MPLDISGGLFARNAATGVARQSPVNAAFEFDPLRAEAQGIMRGYSTSQQIEADYAASRVLSSQEYAQRELERLQGLKDAGIDIDQSRLDELNSIANPSFLAQAIQAGAPVFKVLEYLDRPRQALTLALNDVLGWDEKEGVEITAGDYADVFRGNKQELIDKLGIAVVGEDGMIGFSTVLDDLGWEKTDNTFNKWARFGATLAGEIVTDPFTFTGIGAHGFDKAARMRFLQSTIDDTSGLLGAAIRAGDGAAIREAGGDLGDQMFKRGVDRHSSLVTELTDEVELALRGDGPQGVLERLGIEGPPPDVPDIDAFVHQALSAPAVQRTISESVIEQAVTETADGFFNRAIAPLLAKDFADPALKLVADAPNGSTYLKGGLRVTVPILSKRLEGRGIKASVVAPGSRGFGRKVSNTLFGHSREYAKAGRQVGPKGVAKAFQEGLGAPIYERWREVFDKFSNSKNLNDIMAGRNPNARASLRIQDEMAFIVDGVTRGARLTPIADAAIKLAKRAKEADMAPADIERMLAGMSRVFEMRRGATFDEMIEGVRRHINDAGGSMDTLPVDVQQAIWQWTIEQRNSLDFLEAEAIARDMIPRGLSNYTPHVVTAEANELLDAMIKEGVVISGDDIGSQILRSMLEARRRAQTVGETVVGEAAATSQRTVGRAAELHVIGSDPMAPLQVGRVALLDNNLAAREGGLQIGELNEMFRDVLERAMEENPRLRLPDNPRSKELPFEFYNEDPFATMQIYGHDLTMAIAERDMIELLENAGLVHDATRVVNQQLLAGQVAGNLSRHGEDALQAATAELQDLVDGKLQQISDLANDIDIDDKFDMIDVGGVSVPIPRSALEANRRLAKKVARMNNVGKTAAEVQARRAAFYTDTFNALRKKGVDENVAHQLAEAATVSEVRGILKEARAEVKGELRKRLQLAKIANSTRVDNAVTDAERLYQKVAGEEQVLKAKEKEANRKVTAALREAGAARVEVATVTPMTKAEDIAGLTAGVRQQMMDDLTGAADILRAQGAVEEARMVETIRDFITYNDSAELESLGVNIGDIVNSALEKNRARREWFDAADEAEIAYADQFVDQAMYYEGNLLDPGDWGPEVYADAQFLFHGSDKPSAANLAQSKRFAGGGLTANPQRAVHYASDGWIVIYDLDSMPDEIVTSVREAGQDVEQLRQLQLLVGTDGAMPQPIAVVSTRAMREAIARRAINPDQVEELFRQTAAATAYDTIGDLTEVFSRHPDELAELHVALHRASVDPSFIGTEEFEATITRLVNATDGGQGPVGDFVTRLREELTRVEDWRSKGGVDPNVRKPSDIRTDSTRAHALSAWRDRWASEAAKGTPVRQVGEPTPAPWVDATMASNTTIPEMYQDLYARLKGANTADFAAAVDNKAIDSADLNNLVEEFFAHHFHLARSGQLTPEMQDLYDASRRSLRARGLEEEFPAWVVTNDQGMARLSLTPIEGAEVMVVRRSDVSLDWGALYPQDTALLDAAARANRHHILVDPARLQIPHTDYLDGLEAAAGLPPKTSLHNMRPENFTYNKMLQYFGDPDVADRALADLYQRMDSAAAPHAHQLATLAELQGKVLSMQSGQWRLGILRSAENIFRNPEELGQMFEDPDIARWFREQVQAAHGVEIEYTRMTVIPDGKGGYRQSVPGSAGGIEVTVPAVVERTLEQRPMLSRTELNAALNELDMTATELRMAAQRAAAFRSMSLDELRNLPREVQLQLHEANDIFKSRPELYNTVMGVTDELTQTVDRARRLADEFQARKGGGEISLDRTLGAATGSLSVTETVGVARRSLDELVGTARLRGGESSVSVVSARTGLSPTRGVSVSTGQGKIRYALPDGLTDEVVARIEADLLEWVVVNSDDLSRPGAHIMMRRQGDEVIVEIGAVVDSQARARRMGMRLDEEAVFNLATGEAVNLPPTAKVAKKALREAEKQGDAVQIFDELDAHLSAGRMAQAEALITDPLSRSRLLEVLGEGEYHALVDHVMTERVLALDMIPEKEALRSARQARKILLNEDSAVQAARQVREEALTVQRLGLEDEVADLLETQTKVADFITNLLERGLGPDRTFGDASLYPTAQGTVTKEASELLKEQLDEAVKLSKRLGWGDVADALEEADRAVPFGVVTPPGEHTFSVYGIGGRATEFKTTSEPIASLIEQTMSRWQVLTTPPGLEMFTKQLRWIAKAWKSMATVARPNFHPRNFIGAAFNNMAVDVRFVDYNRARQVGLKYRRLRNQGMSLDEMAAEFGDDWAFVDAARRQGIFGEGFAAGDLKVELPRTGSLRDTLVNPASGDFVLNRAGGYAMQSIEDFHRLAAFSRWFEEIGEAGARDMVNMVHFNYANLTSMERQIKKVVPFFVWTRNNVPLQIRLMMERPGLATRYTHLMSSVEDNFGGEGEQWPRNQFGSPLAADLGIQAGSDQSWARLVFDPDLPIKDLAAFETFNPFSVAGWASFVGNALGPHVTTPLNIAEQNEWGQTNAPFGWNAAMRIGGLFIPGYDPLISDEGDAQVGYGTKNLMATLFPIINEYSQLAGVSNDPNQLQRLGIDSSDGVSVGERLGGAARFLGRGVGINSYTPNDARIAAYTNEERAREIVNELKLLGVLQPGDQESNRAVLAQARAAGLIP